MQVVSAAVRGVSAGTSVDGAGGVVGCPIPLKSLPRTSCTVPLAATIPGATTAEATEPVPGTVELVLGSNFNGIGQPVTAPEPVEPVEGEDARTAADTTCIN